MKELFLVIIILITLVGLSVGLTVNQQSFASSQVVNKIMDSCKKVPTLVSYSAIEPQEDLINCINLQLEMMDYRLISELPDSDNH